MSGKWLWRCVSVAIADVIALALTIHANLGFHRTTTGPEVMTVGQVLGWIISVVLFVVLILMVVSARHSRR